MAKLFGIGVGPGNPGFLTVQALNIIKECSAIVLPAVDKDKCISWSIVSRAYPEVEQKKLLFCDFPMTKEPEKLQLAQEKAAEEICSELEKDRSVCFLTLGDPTVYSTYMYVHYLVEDKGYSAEIVNGIPSFCAVAARLGVSLAEQEQQIHIIPGSYDIQQTFNLEGTLVFMKSGKKLSELKEFLVREKKYWDFEFYSVSNCGMENEIVCKNLEELNGYGSYLTIVIIKNKKRKDAQKNYSFFQNNKCEMFPCHKNCDAADFNCLFCYCPLYLLGDQCGGNFRYTESGIKSCVDCSFPHVKENYSKIIAKMKENLAKNLKK